MYGNDPEWKHKKIAKLEGKCFCAFTRDHFRTLAITNRSIPFITWNWIYFCCNGDFIQFMHERGQDDIIYSVCHSWRIFFYCFLYMFLNCDVTGHVINLVITCPRHRTLSIIIWAQKRREKFGNYGHNHLQCYCSSYFLTIIDTDQLCQYIEILRI